MSLKFEEQVLRYKNKLKDLKIIFEYLKINFKLKY